MRVLFWSETFWPRVGGVERLAAGLVPALRDRGHELSVVTWVDDGETAEGCFQGIPVHRVPFFAGAGRAGAARTMEQLDEVRRLKRRFAPDLVHVNSCGRSAWFHLATQAAAAPTLVTVHQPLAAGLDARDTVTGRLLATASWITCCSEAVLATVRRHVPSMAARASVIENALPEVCAAPPPPLVPPRLLFVGRLVPEKGLDAVLGALAPLFRRVPRARLVVAGDGPLRPQLEAQVAERGLGAHVRFLGAVPPEAVRELMAEASVVVVPSRIEGFGLVALEAALMGRPVVATRAGGLELVVEHGRTGLLVEVDDGAGFVRAIETLIDEPAAARRLGEAARRRARERFDWERHVRAYDDLYRRLAA